MVTDSGFLGTTPTLSCSQLGDDALVQVSIYRTVYWVPRPPCPALSWGDDALVQVSIYRTVYWVPRPPCPALSWETMPWCRSVYTAQCTGYPRPPCPALSWETMPWCRSVYTTQCTGYHAHPVLLTAGRRCPGAGQYIPHSVLGTTPTLSCSQLGDDALVQVSIYHSVLGTTPTLSCSQLGDDALVQVSIYHTVYWVPRPPCPDLSWETMPWCRSVYTTQCTGYHAHPVLLTAGRRCPGAGQYIPHSVLGTTPTLS